MSVGNGQEGGRDGEKESLYQAIASNAKENNEK